ncbi:MAG TPA: VWA domain-containing protein, partial [Gemmataceae bacterium]|nr:VWA domain-containing protein [Gemmataceae bacterium]
VLCLDTSGSMNGLLDSARRRLWAVVNDMAKLEATPTLRVAVYSYGNNAYDPARGWVRKETDLTTDLDEVHKRLHALTIASANSSELVARVTRDAVADLKWAAEPNALRIVFVCGNEPADQDTAVTVRDVAAAARAKGVVVNTIYCGPPTSADAAGWKEFAAACGGKFASIEQNRAAAEEIATPFDAEITKLGDKLNGTYLWYGATGRDGALKQQAGDLAALQAAGGAAADRAATKAGRFYKNAEADLIDRVLADKSFDLKKLKAEELPEEMRKLKPEDREAYVKKKATEREEIQKKVTDLTARRALYVEAERKRQPTPPAEKALDEALREILRDQASPGAKGPKGK